VSTDLPSKPVLPKEARDGVMRVWLEILRERHSGFLWVARSDVGGSCRPALGRTRT
jgi:hypothetical protein